MNPTRSRIAYDVRPYREEDEQGVLALLESALGAGPAGVRSPEFFRWKHVWNPFGPSFMLVAEAHGRIIGLRAFMRWRFQAHDRTLSAVQAVDTATHPEFQGMGIFSRLTRAAVDSLRDEIDLVFNTPNEKSLPGYLKMGWQVVGRIPVWVRVRRLGRFAMALPSLRGASETSGDQPALRAQAAAKALHDGQAVEELLDAARTKDPRFHTAVDLEYLRWRYDSIPLFDYRAVWEEGGGGLIGVAFFRVRPRGRLWESTVTDLIVRPGDRATARKLLGRVARSSRVDHLTCHFPPRSVQAGAARRYGFVRSPVGVTFTVNPLDHEIRPDPTDLGSWAVSLGDLEVF